MWANDLLKLFFIGVSYPQVNRGGTFWQSSNNDGILTRNVEYHNSYVYTEDLNNKKISNLLGLLIKLKYPYLNKITAWANENF